MKPAERPGDAVGVAGGGNWCKGDRAFTSLVCKGEVIDLFCRVFFVSNLFAGITPDSPGGADRK